MPVDSTARPNPSQATIDDDYRSFCVALSERARGRNFLAEFAKRNRHADTEMLLAGIDRLEALMRAEGAALERLRDELRVLLITIRLARPDIGAASPPDKTAKLASLLDMLEQRIDGMVEVKRLTSRRRTMSPCPRHPPSCRSPTSRNCRSHRRPPHSQPLRLCVTMWCRRKPLSQVRRWDKQ